MADATFLTPPSPRLSATMFPNKSVEPYSPKGQESKDYAKIYTFATPGRLPWRFENIRLRMCQIAIPVLVEYPCRWTIRWMALLISSLL